MKVTSKLALKYLRKNKKRNYAIVLGIALATILLISVFILIASYQEYIVNIIRDEKNWEVELHNIEYAKALEVENYDNIKEVSILYNIGLDSKVNRIEDTFFTVQLNVTAYNENALNKINLISGRFPENNSEIVLSDKIDIGKNVGDTLEITINGVKQEYNIVGIAEKLENEDDFNAINRVNGVMAYYDKDNISPNDKVNISILTKDIKKIYQTVNNLTNDLGLYENEESKKDNIVYNNTLLNYSLVQDREKLNSNQGMKTPIERNSEEFDTDLAKVLGILILIIMIVSMILIYTTFSITYNERIKEIGMLSAIGMSKKQLNSMLIKENGILATIGIVIGELLGTGLMYFIIKAMNILLSKQLESSSR